MAFSFFLSVLSSSVSLTSTLNEETFFPNSPHLSQLSNFVVLLLAQIYLQEVINMSLWEMCHWSARVFQIDLWREGDCWCWSENVFFSLWNEKSLPGDLTGCDCVRGAQGVYRPQRWWERAVGLEWSAGVDRWFPPYSPVSPPQSSSVSHPVSSQQSQHTPDDWLNV